MSDLQDVTESELVNRLKQAFEAGSNSISLPGCSRDTFHDLVVPMTVGYVSANGCGVTEIQWVDKKIEFRQVA